jgi:L-amino acid N-acyltransferase YncA
MDAKDRRLRISRLGRQDIGQLTKMYLSFDRDQIAFGLPPRGMDRIQTWLESLFESDVQLIAKHNQDVVAHAAWIKDGSKRAEVMVFVHQDYRGAGVGKKLLTAVVTMSRFMGLDLLWAEVENHNSPMIHINHELGFETIAWHHGSREMTLESL